MLKNNISNSFGDTVSWLESSLDGPTYTTATFPATFLLVMKLWCKLGLKKESDHKRSTRMLLS